MVVRIGYKASAEQFGPSELLEFSVERAAAAPLASTGSPA